jgi:hypothetical protein
VAAVTFIALGRVRWPPALVMAGGAIVGGYAGAVLARRVPRVWVRRSVEAIGFVIAAIMFWKQLAG